MRCARSIAPLLEAFNEKEGEDWAVMGVVMTREIDEIIEDIRNGTELGVSNGSFKNLFGTASWVIENASGSQRILGNVLIPGFKSDQSAYRSEIGGIYGLVLVVELTKEMWNLDKGAIIIGCDGINDLYQALDVAYNPTTSNQKRFNLLSGIQEYVRYSTIQYIPKHVKVHRNDNGDISNLDQIAILNIKADFWGK